MHTVAPAAFIAIFWSELDHHQARNIWSQIQAPNTVMLKQSIDKDKASAEMISSLFN